MKPASDINAGIRRKTGPQMQNPAPDAKPDIRRKIRSRCKIGPRFKANNATSDAKACPGGKPGTPAKPGTSKKPGFRHKTGAGETLAKCKGQMQVELLPEALTVDAKTFASSPPRAASHPCGQTLPLRQRCDQQEAPS